MTTNAARHPKGIPTGGRFAATTHPEPALNLAAEAQTAWKNDSVRELNTTQRRSVAASLETDGRPDVAASAGVTGHIGEFQMKNSEPYSQKAKKLAELREALNEAVTTHGVAGTVAALRAEA